MSTGDKTELVVFLAGPNPLDEVCRTGDAAKASDRVSSGVTPRDVRLVGSSSSPASINEVPVPHMRLDEFQAVFASSKSGGMPKVGRDEEVRSNTDTRPFRLCQSEMVRYSLEGGPGHEYLHCPVWLRPPLQAPSQVWRTG